MPASFQALGRRSNTLYQVTFSDQSMQMLNELPVEDQLKMVDRISAVKPDDLKKATSGIGKFHRDGRTYYRVKAGEFRCYFEVQGDTLYAHYILHHNTLMDFVYRNKLPVNAEKMAEQHTDFWSYLDSVLKK